MKKIITLGFGKQIILNKKISRRIFVFLLIYTSVIAFINLDTSDPDLLSKIIIYFSLSLIFANVIREFFAGETIGLWLANIVYDDSELNIGTRWLAFLMGIVFFALLPTFP